MRLAREDDLNRAIRIIEDSGQAIRIVEQERRSLVGCEAAREANGQHLLLQERTAGEHLTRIAAVHPSLPEPLAKDVQQSSLPAGMRLPEDIVGNSTHSAPDIGIGLVIPPFGSEVRIEHPGDPRCDPGLQVDAVGDVPDRHILNRTLGPDATPHLAGHLAVLLAHAVAVIGQAHRYGRHVEVVAGLIEAAHRIERIPADSELRPEVTEVAIHQLRAEMVVPSRDRRVRRKDSGRRDKLLGVLKRLTSDDVLPQALQQAECSVALVRMPVSRGATKRTESADTAYAEDHLLAQPMFTVTTVEARRDGARPLRVAFNIRVKQEELHAPDPHLPDRELDRVIRVLEREIDQDRLAVLVQHLGRRLGVWLEVRRHVLLPAVLCQALAQIPLPIEQRHGADRQTEIARLLDVIAGKDAETTRVDRTGAIEPERG